MSAGLGGTPVLEERWLPTAIPTQLQIYNSYAIDPQWQIKFTIIWTSVLAFSTLVSVPFVIRSYRNGRLYCGLLIREHATPPRPAYQPVDADNLATRRDASRASAVRWLPARLSTIVQSLGLWTLPLPRLAFWRSQIGDCCRRAYFTLSIFQTFTVLAYLAVVLACVTVGANLIQNPNRAGFLALAQLPLVLVLSIKSPLPLPVFLPSLSYEHYNFLHRWVGRILFLCATIHGGIWVQQFRQYEEWDQLSSTKAVRGLLSYGLLIGIVVTSLKPVRRMWYQLFWTAHIALFTGFFAAISYHTPYSHNWVIACAAIYAYDLTVRSLRWRVKSATLVPIDHTMTMIHIPDCDVGWLPTQHVLLRVVKGVGIFESHPFTITNAPASSTNGRGITLYAKVSGDWTARLNRMSRSLPIEADQTGAKVEERLAFLGKEHEGTAEPGGFDHPGEKVMVVLDGPYGGLKIDLGLKEAALLVAGGSGITFALGSIEEAIRCRQAGRGPSKVDVAWVVRDLSTVVGLARTLAHLHTTCERLGIELAYKLYLSEPPTPLPSVPALLPSSTTLSPYRPEVAQLVRTALPLAVSAEVESGPVSGAAGGGLAVVACGPEGIVKEAGNAVAGLGVGERVRCGGVDFHGESYAL